MKILVINGSPRGKRSNSLCLANSFVDGVRDVLEANGQEVIVDEIDVIKLNIAPCKGCFGCWRSAQGTCVIKDDMQEVLQKRIAADLIVWSFPLYFFNVPGPLKNFIDRQLPMALPFMEERADGYGSGSHPLRYEHVREIKNVLVSTCGFYSAEGNYDSVREMFNHVLGKGNYSEIFCGQGELFHIESMHEQTDAYLSAVRQAGAEYMSGGITEETDARLHELLTPKEAFEAAADASWGVNKETGEKLPDDLIFTKQMAAMYNKASYDGKDRVVEMRYTDTGHSYLLVLGKERCEVLTDGSRMPDMTIETPFEVWLAISRGEIGGSEALGQGKYRVLGDFEMLSSWGTYFGTGSSGGAAAKKVEKAVPDELKPPKMLSMLIPWIVFWIAVSFNATTGSIATIAVTALLPAFFVVVRKRRLLLWDLLSCLMVTTLSLAAYCIGEGDLVTTVSYLFFGQMWLLSCTKKEDLCASYVKYGYGGDAALDNPLFSKTCHILTLAWGALYVATGIWTFFLRQAGVGDIVVVVNNVVPLGMGVFTKWFQKWYPAKLARG